MPQIKKEEVRDRLYFAAKNEFLKVGFQQASLRTIAKAAKVSLANVYSYHPNKDALFSAVVAELKADLDQLTEGFRNYRPTEAELDPLELEIARAKKAAEYIHKRATDFHLLFNQATGSSLENYSEELVAGYVANCKSFLKFLKESGFTIAEVPSDFFFAAVARMFISALKEVVKNQNTKASIQKYADELTRYNSYGFRGISSTKTKGKDNESLRHS